MESEEIVRKNKYNSEYFTNFNSHLTIGAGLCHWALCVLKCVLRLICIVTFKKSENLIILFIA